MNAARVARAAAIAAMAMVVAPAFGQGGTGDSDYGKVVPSQARAFAKSLLLVSADADGTRGAIEALTDADMPMLVTPHWVAVTARGGEVLFYKDSGRPWRYTLKEPALKVADHPLSDAELLAKAREYARLLETPSLRVEVEPCQSNDVTADFAVMQYHGKFLMNGVVDGMTITKDTGKLLCLEFTGFADYGPFTDAKLVSEEEATRSAYDAYQRHQPFASAVHGGVRLLLGYPWMGKPVATEWTPEEASWVSGHKPFPFYRVTVLGGCNIQQIDVNAMDGHVMSIYWAGGVNASPTADRPAVSVPNLSAVRVVGGTAIGKLDAAGVQAKNRPAGTAVVVAAGKALLAGVSTPDGKVWLNQDGRWKAYRPAKALAKDIKSLIKKPVKPFGKAKLAKAG